MNSSVEMTLEKPHTRSMAVAEQLTPMELVSRAVLSGDVSMEVVRELTAWQKDNRKYEAEVAFGQAMHRAQSNMRRVGADANNPQTKSRYATYAKLDGVLRPVYSKEGLSVSFDTADPPAGDMVRVVAYVSHEQGHTRRYQIDMPADGKGAKGGDVMTKTHATGSATAYGMRYLLKMIFNVAVGETDDDGNGAGGDLPEQDYISILDNIASASIEELKGIYIAGYKAAVEVGDRTAMAGIIAAKDKRKAELQEAA